MANATMRITRRPEQAARKKHKKACKKKSRCRKRGGSSHPSNPGPGPSGGPTPGPPGSSPGGPAPADAIAALTASLKSNSLTRTFFTGNNGPGGSSTSGEELINLCADGSYKERLTTSRDGPGGGSTSESMDQRTWSIAQAQYVPGTTTSFRATIQIASTAGGPSGPVQIGVTPNQVTVPASGYEYVRGQAAC